MKENQLDRALRISENIQNVSETAYEIRIVPSINNDLIQGVANGDNGSVDLTSGLMDALKDDSEVAFIIAHEVAHFVHDDARRAKDALKRYGRKVADGINRVDAELKRRGHGFIVRTLSLLATGAIGCAAGYAEASAISQKCETEADELALEYMKEAGYDPEKAITALKTLHGGYLPDMDFWNGLIHSMTGTHPIPAERAQRLRKNNR